MSPTGGTAVVVRSPLRLPLGGGGTDLPAHADRHGGCWLAAAVDVAVEVTLLDPPGAPPVSPAGARPLVEAALAARRADGPPPGVRVRSPVPAGTGLGSSGALAVALVVALDHVERTVRSPEELAAAALGVERAAVGPTAGYQDPWASALGGLRWYEVAPGGDVRHRQLTVGAPGVEELDRRLGLFGVGGTRSSASVLADAHRRSTDGDREVLENLRVTADLGVASRDALEQGDLDGFGRLLHEHWCNKRRRSPGMTTGEVDRAYALALEAGALGGKLVGGGGGGYLLTYARDPDPVRAAMAAAGLAELPFSLGASGASVLGPSRS